MSLPHLGYKWKIKSCTIHILDLLNLNKEYVGFPGSSVVKNPPANAGDWHFIPEWERSAGGGNGNPLQYSCLGNPMDK